ncbi:hypothetical protein MMC22_011098, partial [Lobaria immixta]|nr:hypothetical protein [Lobaria immixta]
MSEKNPQTLSRQNQEGESQNESDDTKKDFNGEGDDSEEENRVEDGNEGGAGGDVDDGS